ncbi:MAG: hypothetical protein FWE31_03005 [Firmicutes bacterium]|nr:hypothetical protein [Bacillota bacterium]
MEKRTLRQQFKGKTKSEVYADIMKDKNFKDYRQAEGYAISMGFDFDHDTYAPADAWERYNYSRELYERIMSHPILRQFEQELEDVYEWNQGDITAVHIAADVLLGHGRMGLDPSPFTKGDKEQELKDYVDAERVKWFGEDRIEHILGKLAHAMTPEVQEELAPFEFEKE